LPAHTMRRDALLFGESQSRIIVSLAQEGVSKIMSIAENHSVPAIVIGKVGGKRLKVDGLIDVSVDDLKTAWKGSIERLLKG
ncbi:MAG: phosphoribosylformylglycinamidine synthase II, partial [Deltaproteobacteria bacterium]|nr:phosphoribosylformylglycinamidine synthase II [Deltaproteobacteria bacterium]